MCKIFFLINIMSIGLLWRFSLGMCEQLQEMMDYPLTVTYMPEKKLHPAGKELLLHCWDHNKQSSSHHKINNYKWYYKRCGKNVPSMSCQEHSGNEPWISLCGNDSQNRCNSTLLLSSPSEADSGLYKCSASHRNRTSKHSNIHLFQLEIWDLKTSPPEFQPKLLSNMTVEEGTPAVFQCRVYSKLLPMFFWFRKLGYTVPNATNSVKYLKLLDETYETLQSSGERALSEEFHISKLIISKTVEKDSGHYVCVAVNVAGFNIQGIQLNVLKNLKAQMVSDGVASSSLLLLFLIPVVIVLAFLTIWACCPCKKWQMIESRHKYTSVNIPTNVCCIAHTQKSIARMEECLQIS